MIYMINGNVDHLKKERRKSYWRLVMNKEVSKKSQKVLQNHISPTIINAYSPISSAIDLLETLGINVEHHFMQENGGSLIIITLRKMSKILHVRIDSWFWPWLEIEPKDKRNMIHTTIHLCMLTTEQSALLLLQKQT